MDHTVASNDIGGLTITYSINQPTFDASYPPCQSPFIHDVDISITDNNGHYAHASDTITLSDWTDTWEWDGHFTVGDIYWNQCDNLEIHVAGQVAGFEVHYYGDTPPDCVECDQKDETFGKTICYPCACTGGTQDIEICKKQPNVDFICPLCGLVMTAKTCPMNEEVTWTIEDAGVYIDDVTVSELSETIAGLLFFGDSSGGPYLGPETIVVRAALTDNPGIYDEESFTLWQATNSWPCAQYTCPPFNNTQLTSLECDWLNNHPVCAAQIALIYQQDFNVAAALFPNECSGSVDCKVGNAFLHAWVNCETAKSLACGADLAEEFWTLHETKRMGPPPSICTSCKASAMDLHNNASGRNAASDLSIISCADAVMIKIGLGEMVWGGPQGCADCPAWDSEYGGDCDD